MAGYQEDWGSKVTNEYAELFMKQVSGLITQLIMSGINIDAAVYVIISVLAEKIDSEDDLKEMLEKINQETLSLVPVANKLKI